MNIVEDDVGRYLAGLNWPGGLQQLLIENCRCFPRRYIIVDNSGSMNAHDGHRVVQTPDGPRYVQCSRWSELTESLRFHGNIANVAMAPTEFHFLNGARPLSLGVVGGADLQTLEGVFRTGPGGGTPLCRCLNEVIESIREHEVEWRENRQRAVLIIATDGMADEGQDALRDTLRLVRELPVWVIMRLCTDEDEIVTYWNEIDRELEINMDILDDLQGEAEEVTAQNPWLTYSAPLHSIREWGVAMKELDFIDERPLTAVEVVNLCEVLLPGPVAIPDLEADWAAFETAITTRLARQIPVLNLMTMAYSPLINLEELRRRYQPGYKPTVVDKGLSPLSFSTFKNASVTWSDPNQFIAVSTAGDAPNYFLSPVFKIFNEKVEQFQIS